MSETSDSGEVEEFFRRLGHVRSRMRIIRKKVVRGVILPHSGKNRPLNILNERLKNREKELDSQRIGRGFNLSFNRLPKPPLPPPVTITPTNPTPQPQYPCSECEQIFKSESALEEHKLMYHKKSEKILL